MNIRLSFLVGVMLFVVSVPDMFAQPQWQKTHGPYADLFTSMSVRPNGDLLIWTYAPGTNSNPTLSISSDAGVTWKGILTAAYTTGAMASDSIGRLVLVQGNAIVATTDNGVTWSPLAPLSPTPRCLAVNPGGKIFAGTGGAIYFSSDNGASWTLAYRDPGAYVTINSLTFLASGLGYAGTMGDGVLRSTDFGLTWNAVPGASYAKDFNAVVLLANATLCASSNGYGIFLSADSGLTWTSSNAGSNDGYVLGLAVDGTGSVYAATQSSGLYRSTDNGQTWVLKNTGMSGSGANAVRSAPSGKIFASTGLGLFYSADRGEHWFQRGISPSGINAIGIDGRGIIYAASTGVIFKTTNGGLDWGASRTQGIPPVIDAFAFDAPGRVFIESSGSVFRSSDGGVSWTFILGPEVAALATADSGVYAGADGVLISKNHGDLLTWRTLGLVGYGGIRSLDIVGHGEILAGTSRGIQRSLDSGATWNEVVYSGYQTLCLANSGAGTRLAGTSGLGILRSSNSGDSWALSNAGIASTEIERMVAIGFGDLFALGNSPFRIYRSKDAGITWSDVTAGIVASNGYALTRSPGGFLYAGTDSGLYMLPAGIVGVAGTMEANPVSFALEQNYPNPFNPATTIRYALPRRTHVTLAVFNTLGQQVRTLVNGIEEAGYHQVMYDGTGVASGVYFYRLNTGEYVQTKRFVLVR